jgi:hypothetical protein
MEFPSIHPPAAPIPLLTPEPLTKCSIPKSSIEIHQKPFSAQRPSTICRRMGWAKLPAVYDGIIDLDSRSDNHLGKTHISPSPWATATTATAYRKTHMRRFLFLGKLSWPPPETDCEGLWRANMTRAYEENPGTRPEGLSVGRDHLHSDRSGKVKIL